jgi:PASTA domain
LANGTTRKFVVASAVAVVVTVAFLPGAGLGSSGSAVRRERAGIPAGLAAAIHAKLGAVTVRSSSAASSTIDPELGGAVALSADGTTALVGGPSVAGGNGAAYIFHASAAGSWSSSDKPVATLTNKRSAHAFFGAALALSADGMTAFVGAPLSGSGIFPAGEIDVFHASAEDAWSSSSKPAAKLTVKHGTLVGISLALSPDGTTLVAGAPFYDSFAGGAYVFHASGEGAWTTRSSPTATLSNAAESKDDDLGVGFAVAISADGTTALVSDDSNLDTGGGAYVYHVSSADSWTSSSTPTAILSDASSGSDDSLGNALALSSDGTVALLGAPGADSETGSADVFHSAGEAAWATTSTPTATLSNAGGSSRDGFGINVAVSTDGTTALAFAPYANHKRGAGYVFHVAGEGAWTSSVFPTATLTNSGGKAGDFLGIGAFSTDGATLLAGAPGVDLKTGAAEVFHVTDDSSWASSATPGAILTDKALAACVVPKLKGLKLASAKHALAVGRCNVGKVAKVHGTKKAHGRVLSQSKKPGKRLAIGAKVSLRVGK